MSNNQNDGDDPSSSQERWSGLNHDVLNIVIMQLEFVDFVSFSGVCNSWRSFAHSNGNIFMASKPPMSISFSTDADMKECYLEDFEGRKFKTILPDLTGGSCIGLTCGYLVFFMRETRDLRLVNPITRHQLHFPDYPADDRYRPDRAILVFSASISKWVFVVLFKYSYIIWFSIAGERAWNHVTCHHRIRDSYAFKGKIYAQTSSFDLLELRLDGSQPKLTPLEIRQPVPDFFYKNEFVSSGENFYGIVWDQDRRNWLLQHELDFGEMKWVKVKACEKTLEKYAFFRSEVNRNVVAVKRESWADPRSRSHGRYAYTRNIFARPQVQFITAKMWYFPHECVNVDLIDE